MIKQTVKGNFVTSFRGIPFFFGSKTELISDKGNTQNLRVFHIGPFFIGAGTGGKKSET